MATMRRMIHDGAMMPVRVKDLTGVKRGRVTVVEFAGLTSDRKSLWKIRCDCGNTKVVQASNLRKRGTGAIGCGTPCGSGGGSGRRCEGGQLGEVADESRPHGPARRPVLAREGPSGDPNRPPGRGR